MQLWTLMGQYRANSARSRLPVGRSGVGLNLASGISLAREHQYEGYRRRCEQEIAHHRGRFIRHSTEQPRESFQLGRVYGDVMIFSAKACVESRPRQ